jgi:hypothetical protein
MSYHEIAVKKGYALRCRDCKFEAVTEAAAEAEKEARSHIEFDDTKAYINPLPNWNHTVEITEVTTVGR